MAVLDNTDDSMIKITLILLNYKKINVVVVLNRNSNNFADTAAFIQIINFTGLFRSYERDPNVQNWQNKLHLLRFT